ncbi:MAG: heme exporter protein CcmB [Pseudomonadota bacterium]
MYALFVRDLQLALRLGGGLWNGLSFFVIAVALLAFGVGPDAALLAQIAPGGIWVFALLACLLSLDRLFQADAEDGALDLIVLSPTPLEGAVLAKAAAHWLTSGLPLTLFAPAAGVMLSLPPQSIGPLVATLAIGTPALSLIGAVGAALTLGVRRGGLLLSVLVLPLYVPSLIFGALAVRSSAVGLEIQASLLMLGATTLGCLALAPFAAAAALRINQS